MTSTHYLRLSPAAYRGIALGQRNALVLSLELRVAVGDQLVVREWNEGTEGRRGVFTGNWALRRVTDELVDHGVADGYAVYSLGPSADSHRATVLLKRQLGLAEQQGVAPDRFWRHQEKLERTRRARVERGTAAVARARRAAAEGTAP